jgi:small subunit ribosomal protein S18
MLKKTISSRKTRPINNVCPFCDQKKEPDYKDYQFLANFLTDRARIMPASRTGVCAKHQRKLSREVKRARFLALLPYIEKIS